MILIKWNFQVLFDDNKSTSKTLYVTLWYNDDPNSRNGVSL